MKFAIITHTPHYKKETTLYAYGPYIREMNIWGKYVDDIRIVAPFSKNETSSIHSPYVSDSVNISTIPAISFISFSEAIKALWNLPVIKWKIFNEMRKADHIHLRCPGTIGLIGCCMQVFFPKKPKTAKYAGNWDPNAKQPLSYRLQKWILSNTLLTKNMQVLVYGNWPDQTHNIKPFFTATYSKSKIVNSSAKDFSPPYRFLFVGSLVPGKQPLYVLQLICGLLKRGIECRLDIYGEGSERARVEEYIQQHNVSEAVTLHGNQSSEIVEKAYKKSHFLILPSRSEGWPKVVAEAMFWGTIPIVTQVSCVPWMLDGGKRGIMLSSVLETDMEQLSNALENPGGLAQQSERAQEWSHHYTIDYFEAEIKKLLA